MLASVLFSSTHSYDADPMIDGSTSGDGHAGSRKGERGRNCSDRIRGNFSYCRRSQGRVIEETVDFSPSPSAGTDLVTPTRVVRSGSRRSDYRDCREPGAGAGSVVTTTTVRSAGSGLLVLVGIVLSAPVKCDDRV